MIVSILAAPTGSTGNNTHASIRAHPATQSIGFVLIVENGGASPQISWKVQGAMVVDGVADGSGNWFDLALLPANSNTLAAIPLVVNPASTGTVSSAFLSQVGFARFVKRLRVVTSANTNVTYRCETHQNLT